MAGDRGQPCAGGGRVGGGGLAGVATLGLGLRPAVAEDAPAIAPLHEAEFPDAYASAAQLVDGSRTALVAEAAGGRVVGYAAGEVHGDGEGFVDFVAVDPSAAAEDWARPSWWR